MLSKKLFWCVAIGISINIFIGCEKEIGEILPDSSTGPAKIYAYIKLEHLSTSLDPAMKIGVSVNIVDTDDTRDKKPEEILTKTIQVSIQNAFVLYEKNTKKKSNGKFSWEKRSNRAFDCYFITDTKLAAGGDYIVQLTSNSDFSLLKFSKIQNVEFRVGTGPPRIAWIVFGGKNNSNMMDILVRFSEKMEEFRIEDFKVETNSKEINIKSISTNEAEFQTAHIKLDVAISMDRKVDITIEKIKSAKKEILDGDYSKNIGGSKFFLSTIPKNLKDMTWIPGI
jgi:hypothetical protein